MLTHKRRLARGGRQRGARRHGGPRAGSGRRDCKHATTAGSDCSRKRPSEGLPSDSIRSLSKSLPRASRDRLRGDSSKRAALAILAARVSHQLGASTADAVTSFAIDRDYCYRRSHEADIWKWLRPPGSWCAGRSGRLGDVGGCARARRSARLIATFLRRLVDMSLFGSIQLGANTLRAMQIGLQVTGNNIANANTPGFVRQEVDLLAGAGAKDRQPGARPGRAGRRHRRQDRQVRARPAGRRARRSGRSRGPRGRLRRDRKSAQRTVGRDGPEHRVHQLLQLRFGDVLDDPSSRRGPQSRDHAGRYAGHDAQQSRRSRATTVREEFNDRVIASADEINTLSETDSPAQHASRHGRRERRLGERRGRPARRAASRRSTGCRKSSASPSTSRPAAR